MTKPRDLATLGGGFTQSGTGAVQRSVENKLKDTVSVKDFGAVGDGVADDTTALAAALATNKNVFIPEGIYLTTATVNVGYGQMLCGAGQHKTTIKYTGAATGVYLGGPGNVTLIYNCELRDLTVNCTNRGANVVGVMLENCVYFNVENISIFGSGSPNSVNPADRVLYGFGLYLTNNTILGRVSHVSCRLWNYGYYLKTLPASQSYWTASIVFDGQGELANCMRGIVVGDPTVNLYSGVGCVFRDLAFQGCYTTGINIYSGDNTIVDSCYFEGNGNYDIAVGTPAGAPTPIGVKITNNVMNSEDIGTTPYGTFPYIAKVYVDRGILTTIRDNNMSISTSIPLISLTASATSSNITGNRLNSIIAAASRISDGSTTTSTADNLPEKPRTVSGSLTRTLSAASGTVAYTGLGFKPTSIEFTGAVDTVPEWFIGWADANSNGSRCLTSDGTGAMYSSGDCIRIIRSSTGNEQKATLVSFDADGFTLSWTKVGSPPANSLVVNYIARR